MLRSIVTPTLLPLFLASLLIAGCGDQPKGAEKSNSPVKSVNVSSPETKNGQSASTPVAAQKAAPPAAPAVLEEVRQFTDVLDFAKLPMPTGGTAGNISPTRFSASVPLPVRATVDFYLGNFDALGWKPVGPSLSESVTDSFAQASLEKDGYRLTMTAMPGEAKLTSVQIEQHGDLDSRTLPRVEGAEDQYSDRGSSLYFTTAKIDAATASLRKLLKADGWHEYDQAFSQKAVRPDADDLLFRKKAYSLHVSIGKPAAQPDKSSVQYYITTLARDMPAPPDAGHVEIEDSRWILTCDTPRDVAAAADYYRTAMKEIGFAAAPKETSSDKWRTLAFESPDHDLVVVSLEPAKDKGAKVKLEGYSAAFREALKKAEEADRLKREAEEKAAAADKAARIKAFQAESARQDKIIESAIGAAVKSATQSGLPKGSSKKIEDDVKAKVEKALQDAGADKDARPAK
jgi:hypothetical protein